MATTQDKTKFHRLWTAHIEECKAIAYTAEEEETREEILHHVNGLINAMNKACEESNWQEK